MPKKTGHTRKTTDWLGREKEEHFDTAGKKVGETRFSKDLLGRPKQEHFNTKGRKTGETKRGKDWLGRPRAEHYDSRQQRVGTSRGSTDWLGRPVQDHFDKDGTKSGRSRRVVDWLGRPRKEHKGEYYKASPKATTSNYNDKDSSFSDQSFQYSDSSSGSGGKYGALVGWLVGIAFVFIAPPIFASLVANLFPRMTTLTLHPLWVLPVLLVFPFGPAILLGIWVARLVNSRR